MTFKEVAILFAVILGAFALLYTVAMSMDIETYTMQHDGCVLREAEDWRWPGYRLSVEREVFCPL